MKQPWAGIRERLRRSIRAESPVNTLATARGVLFRRRQRVNIRAPARGIRTHSPSFLPVFGFAVRCEAGLRPAVALVLESWAAPLVRALPLGQGQRGAEPQRLIYIRTAGRSPALYLTSRRQSRCVSCAEKQLVTALEKQLVTAQLLAAFRRWLRLNIRATARSVPATAAGSISAQLLAAFRRRPRVNIRATARSVPATAAGQYPRNCSQRSGDGRGSISAQLLAAFRRRPRAQYPRNCSQRSGERPRVNIRATARSVPATAAGQYPAQLLAAFRRRPRVNIRARLSAFEHNSPSCPTRVGFAVRCEAGLRPAVALVLESWAAPLVRALPLGQTAAEPLREWR